MKIKIKANLKQNVMIDRNDAGVCLLQQSTVVLCNAALCKMTVGSQHDCETKTSKIENQWYARYARRCTSIYFAMQNEVTFL